MDDPLMMMIMNTISPALWMSLGGRKMSTWILSPAVLDELFIGRNARVGNRRPLAVFHHLLEDGHELDLTEVSLLGEELPKDDSKGIDIGFLGVGLVLQNLRSEPHCSEPESAMVDNQWTDGTRTRTVDLARSRAIGSTQ